VESHEEMFANGKHTYLLRYLVYYGHKTFYGEGLGIFDSRGPNSCLGRVFNFKVGRLGYEAQNVHFSRTATSRAENSAQVFSFQPKFANAFFTLKFNLSITHTHVWYSPSLPLSATYMF